jgi:hypothetical protein
MAEKTITFTQNAKYDTIPPVLYTAGQRVTLRVDLADRWIKRGLAVENEDATGKPAKKPVEPQADPTVEIPMTWRTLKLDDRVALAKRLGAAPDANLAAADAYIEAEAKKRADAAK